MDVVCYQVIFSDSLWNHLKQRGAQCHALPSKLNPNNFKWLDGWLSNDITLTLNDPNPSTLKSCPQCLPPTLTESPMGNGERDINPTHLSTSRFCTRSEHRQQNGPSNPRTSHATWQFGDADDHKSPSSARQGCLPLMCPALGDQEQCWRSVSCLNPSPAAAAPHWCPSGPRQRANQTQRAHWRLGWGSTSLRGSSFCTHASFHGTCLLWHTDLVMKEK